jgi:hypothetical protein
MNWFENAALALPIGAFALLGIAALLDWRRGRGWWRESEHRSFFRN